MAYNKQFVPLSRVIENAYRRSGEDFIDWESAIEWTAALIRVLGIPASYIQKSTNNQDNNPPFIEVNGYRGILPTDVVVRGNCRRVALNDDGVATRFAAMVESTNIFFGTDSTAERSHPVFFDPYFETVQVDDDGNSESLTLTQEPYYFGTTESFDYKVEGNIIFTQFETGYIEMEYKGFMTDSGGLPMIPDDEKYIRAIMWEIISNNDFVKWRKNPNNTGLKSVYNESNRERDWAVAAAITKARIPTLDEMEAMKNSWLRSIPKTNEHSTNFKTQNKPEIRYNQNNRS